MRQGSTYSFISPDDGATFALEPSVRLTPASFGDLRIRSLHNPWPVLLPDGRVRLYLHGFVEDSSDPHNAILSATQEGG